MEGPGSCGRCHLLGWQALAPAFPPRSRAPLPGAEHPAPARASHPVIAPGPLIRSLGDASPPRSAPDNSSSSPCFPPHTPGNSCLPGIINIYFRRAGWAERGVTVTHPWPGGARPRGWPQCMAGKVPRPQGSGMVPWLPTGPPAPWSPRSRGDTGDVLWGSPCGGSQQPRAQCPPNPSTFRPWAIARAAPRPPSPPGSGG